MEEYVYVQEQGLGKPFWKKIRLKDVSLKNTIKVAKVAVPIVASVIPFVGGAASGILSKVMTNSNGGANFIGRVANTATKLSKTAVGSVITTQAKSLLNSQKKPQIQAVSTITPAGVVMNPTLNSGDQPVGELTPVQGVNSDVEKAVKDNTMLYVLGGVGVLGAIYLATKKS